MSVQLSPTSIIGILFSLVIVSGCNRGTQDNKKCFDTEAFKCAFDNIQKNSKIPLTKELKQNAKNLSQIKAELGDPIEEYTDSFRYGRYVESRNPDKHIDMSYDVFPDTLWRIPLLIVHKCVWARDNKDIVLFFANDCFKGEQPFWGYILEYGDNYSPLRLLPEKDLSLNQVIERRGQPIQEEVYSVYYGVEYSPLEDIYVLRDVPEAIIHRYEWKADSVRTIVLSYLENENKDTAKPVWGMKCLDSYLMYE